MQEPYRKGSSESILTSSLAGDTARCRLKRRQRYWWAGLLSFEKPMEQDADSIPRGGRQHDMLGAGLNSATDRKASPDRSALKPYRGKPAVRNFRGGYGNGGIIRSPLSAMTLLDREPGDLQHALV
jgi:hypothetical protein